MLISCYVSVYVWVLRASAALLAVANLPHRLRWWVQKVISLNFFFGTVRIWAIPCQSHEFVMLNDD